MALLRGSEADKQAVKGVRMSAPSTATPALLADVFLAFLKLGLTSFGGPIAHLHYFRREFVERRRWIDASRYAHLLALCQFLPGPASSQVVFSLGLLRAGSVGAVAAFVGFTLPSALLMLTFAYCLPALSGIWAMAILHGLKLVAVCVVAHGVWRMQRTLAADWQRIAIAALAMLLVLTAQRAGTTLLVLALGAALGFRLCRHVVGANDDTLVLPYGRLVGACLLAAYTLLLAASVLPVAWMPPTVAPAAAFYRAGALVFGGGHVVLPLLQQAVVEPGWIAQSDFLVGYGAAQVVPGPMFSVAVYLGAHLSTASPTPLSAAICLGAIFLPGMLLLAGALPFWHALARIDGAARALAGINAAVVGLLAAALIDPVCSSALHGVGDVIIAAVGIGLLLRVPTLAVIAWCVVAAAVVTAH